VSKELTLGELYNAMIAGEECPEMVINPSSKGPVMLTKTAAYLLDDNGDVVAEVDRDDWIQQLKAQYGCWGKKRLT